MEDSRKLLYIDSMRGWAILMVIACHQALTFDILSTPIRILTGYGQTGVFLFFVVSAYTLCNSTVQRHREENAARNFFIRRYFRIAPLYYTGIIVYLLWNTFSIMEPTFWVRENTVIDVISNLALVHGLMPSAYVGVVPGGWSIGTECAFYLIFPILFIACEKLQTNYSWKILLAPTLGLALIGGILLNSLGMANSLFWYLYDSVFFLIPVFITGILLFYLAKDDKFQPSMRRDIPMFIFTSTIGLWIFYIQYFAALPFVSAISFVFLFNILRKSSSSIGVIERIGRVSYSMYVFHFIFVVITEKIVSAIFPTQGVWTDTYFGIALFMAIIATYSFAKITEKYIEQRFIQFGRTLIKSDNHRLARL